MEMVEKLATEVVVAEWFWLRAHLERGGIIVVASDMDLAGVAAKVASDDAPAIEGWISAGKICKPSIEQIRLWDTTPSKPFRMLVVSPYVLVQEQTV